MREKTSTLFYPHRGIILSEACLFLPLRGKKESAGYFANFSRVSENKMTTAKAAEYTGLDASRLRQEVRAGRLHAERQKTERGDVLWFPETELQRWQEERAKTAAERTGKRGRPLKAALPHRAPGASPDGTSEEQA